MYGIELSKLDNPGELKGIIEDYWHIFTKYNEYHEDNNELRIVVEKSIPIIWFGDLKAYQEKGKKWRIVTVGMNPSFGEFIENGQFVSRFFGADGLNKIDKAEDLDTLIQSYNKYFQYNSYKGNFWTQLKKLLQRFPLPNNERASYGTSDEYEETVSNGCTPKYTAVHIDYHTALATDPIWSQMKNTNGTFKTKYRNEVDRIVDYNLFDRLLDYLAPNVVFFADPVLKKNIEEKVNKLDEALLPLPAGDYYHRDSYIYKNRLYIFGTFGNFPFSMPDEKKETVKGNGKKLEKDFFERSLKKYLARIII